MPCRAGIGYIPTNDLNFGSSSAPSTISPPIGFGRSSTTNGMLLLRRRLHRQRHRRDVGPRAAADFLQVVDEHVDVLQHLGRRAAILGLVERVDRARRSSHRLRRRSSRPPRRAADAVFGREQRDELQVLVLRDQVDVGRPRAVDRAVIGDQPDALAAQRRRERRQEHLDAGQAP